MNGCRAKVCMGDWSSSLNILFSRVNTRTSQRWVAAPTFRRNRASVAEEAPDLGEPEKPRLRAIDLAQKVQQEKAKSKGPEPPKSKLQSRVVEVKRFSLQLQHVHPNVLAKHLKRGLLYQDKDIVVINKPYDIPVREVSGTTSISSVLPVLAKMMDGMKVRSNSQLLPSLGLEKEITGALLLVRNEKALEHIIHLNKNNEVQKKYWVITVGVPVPSEGMIDIPIIEKEVPGFQALYKMALSPVFRMNDAGSGLTKVRGHRQALPAVTKYRVLDSSRGCSLVELQAYPGVKHQMRVHMALALSCPILGDHKYSNWSKLAPQKLPERVLRHLGLEQTKSRHLPLHLHSRQLTLPGTSRADISVTCPMPKFFTQTLSRLHLTFPEEVNQ
ncbi:pseudouridylate synthase RPUSD4, mitochondrial [Aulostomus maculatus]